MFDQYQDSYDKELGYEELSAKTLKELLFGRLIVDVRPGDKNYFGGLDTSALVLDDGTTVYVVPNEGCGGCVTGNWWIDKIAATNNAVTDVRWVTDNYHSNPDIGDCNERVQIFVYTESSTEAKEALPLAGYEDNGFYGYGFELYLVGVETEAKNKEERWDYLK